MRQLASLHCHALRKLPENDSKGDDPGRPGQNWAARWAAGALIGLPSLAGRCPPHSPRSLHTPPGGRQCDHPHPVCEETQYREGHFPKATLPSQREHADLTQRPPHHWLPPGSGSLTQSPFATHQAPSTLLGAGGISSHGTSYYPHGTDGESNSPLMQRLLTALDAT